MSWTRRGCAGRAGVLLLAVAVLATGCSSSAPPHPRPPRASPGPPRTSPSPAELSEPDCSDITQPAPNLTAATTMTPTPGAPWGVSVTSDGQWAFVALGTETGVFRIGRSARPALVDLIRTGGQAPRSPRMAGICC